MHRELYQNVPAVGMQTCGSPQSVAGEHPMVEHLSLGDAMVYMCRYCQQWTEYPPDRKYILEEE